jgi:hypothetical protein
MPVGDDQRLGRQRTDDLHAKPLGRDALQGGGAAARQHVHASREVGQQRRVADAELASDGEDLHRRRRFRRPTPDRESAAYADDRHEDEASEGVGQELLRVLPRLRLGVLAQLVD